MAKSRRKSGGATRGRLKLKKMGKGWLTMRKKRGSVKPIVRKQDEQHENQDRQQENKGS